MKTIAILALLVAAACAQFFCPASESDFQCLETNGRTAYCMSDAQWVCGMCAVKRATCFGNMKPAIYDTTCTRAGNEKIDCSARPQQGV